MNFANEFLEKEENNRKYSVYGKYLVFDCDAPDDIQFVIDSALACDKNYTLLVTNYLFENWLLMHFEEAKTQLSKKEVYRRLSEHLQIKYLKGKPGIIRAIVQKGEVVRAIDNANTLEEHYISQGINVLSKIKEFNPYTNVHTLIEQFMIEISS